MPASGRKSDYFHGFDNTKYYRRYVPVQGIESLSTGRSALDLVAVLIQLPSSWCIQIKWSQCFNSGASVGLELHFHCDWPRSFQIAIAWHSFHRCRTVLYFCFFFFFSGMLSPDRVNVFFAASSVILSIICDIFSDVMIPGPLFASDKLCLCCIPWFRCLNSSDVSEIVYSYRVIVFVLDTHFAKKKLWKYVSHNTFPDFIFSTWGRTCLLNDAAGC
jgi:hypothetical protein